METSKKEELISLISYMIHHNEHHIQELEELASSLKEINEKAYEEIKKAILDFENGNHKLEDSLKEMGR